MIKKSIQSKVDRFNRTYTIGEPVHYYRGPGELGQIDTIKSRAFVFNGRSAVVYLDRKPGLVSLAQVGKYYV